MDDGSIIISIQNLYYRFYLFQNKIHDDTSRNQIEETFLKKLP